MKTLKTTFFTLLVLLVACQSTEKLSFSEIDFQIDGFSWEPNPYKFSDHIQDSILPKMGKEYAAFEYSYIGNQKALLTAWDLEASPQESISDEEKKAFKNATPTPAIPYIIDKAKDYQVTIINEAHHAPQHRIFTTRLLQGLYDQGYRHLGMESFLAIPNSISALAANKYPILTNGFYVKEPQFGNIIREAVKIGYQVFGYESQGHKSGKEREINQATNIKNYMDEHPNEKVFIHCGFAHAAEGNYGSWEKTMAGRLTEFARIDPLTITQTSYSEKSKIELEDPYYQLTKVKEPTVFITPEKKVFGKYRPESWFDVAVFHPRTKNFNRPDWMVYGNRKIVEIDLQQAAISPPYLVFAYLKGEAIGSAIPYDIQEVKEKNIKLVLQPGSYNIVLLNKENKALQLEYQLKD